MNAINATLKSTEEKTVQKDDGSEITTYTAVFEEDGTKVRITQEAPFKKLVIGQDHSIQITTPQSKLET